MADPAAASFGNDPGDDDLRLPQPPPGRDGDRGRDRPPEDGDIGDRQGSFNDREDINAGQ